MKKNSLKIQISILLIIFLFTIIKLNYVYAVDEITSGNCGDNITWSLDSEGTLTITGSGDMTGDQCAWADYAEQVKNVVFNGEITSISERAFKGNSNLESIVLPDSVDSIGMNAFRDCTNLKTVTFPDSLTRIGTAAFYNCSSLDNVELKEVIIMYINDYAFYGCTSLKTMTVRPEFVSIGDDALPELKKINSYKFTDLYFYARHNGIEFTDLNTNETYTGQITNEDFLDKLPTTNLNLGVVQTHDADYGGVESFDFYDGKEEDNETYQEIKSIVDEITAGCTTDRDKAYAVWDWVTDNIKYGGNLIGVPASATGIYYIFNQRAGHCEGFTMVTNYMLYLCGIPTAIVRNTGHEWTAAFVDGEWIYIDSTHYRFDSTDSDAYDIIFLYNGGVYELSEPTEGIEKVASIPGLTTLKGDINNDGKITTLDLNYGLAKLLKGNITEEEEQRGDVTGDGKYTTLDLNKMLGYLLGKIKEL